MPASAQRLYEWHARPNAFKRLAPPWERVKVLREDPGVQVGKRVEIKIGTPIGSKRLIAEHIDFQPGAYFVDTQIEGPFASWIHRHEFRHIDDTRSELRDLIEYELPGRRFRKTLGADFVRKQLARGFAYRHRVLEADFRFLNTLEGYRPLRVVITGGKGFLGTQLKIFLLTQGHEVALVTRRKEAESDIRWDPDRGEIELARLEGFDAMIHLAGESLMSGRWSEGRKRRIWSSRVEGTRFLVDALLRLERPPSVFLGGSGINYYEGDGDSAVDESSPRGEGFLAELCEAWEAASQRASAFAQRVALLRTGIVIDPRGGALKRMLPAFKLGAGGPIGSGDQWFPWIALEDWIKAATWCLFHPKATGAINLVAPESLRQLQFARILGEELRRPTLLTAPKAAVRALFGELADEALLSGPRAVPGRLAEIGYAFQYPKLGQALDLSLGRSKG